MTIVTYHVFFSSDIPQVGLSHGNILGDTDFEILLPNGAVCPPLDHGLPGLDPGVFAPRYRHAIAEADGVVYMCGGNLISSNAYIGMYMYSNNIAQYLYCSCILLYNNFLNSTYIIES